MVALLADSVKQKVLLIRGIQFSAVSHQRSEGEVGAKEALGFGGPTQKGKSHQGAGIR
ncbi:hypothetical protein J4G07_08645 [Candidatus Poribacteria bacterium]|nr:hypothetical protein [Candidatus Poribacteria bacterium]